MRLLLLSFFLSSLLFAYEKGDTVDDKMLQHLGLEADKVYVIDFFASWCSSCKKEIPLISKANEKIDTSKVEIIGIDVDKVPEKGLEFQKMLQEKDQLNFRVINDPQNLIISKFNPKGMPTLFYVKDKVVFKITTGAVDNIDEEILNTLNKHLK